MQSSTIGPYGPETTLRDEGKEVYSAAGDGGVLQLPTLESMALNQADRDEVRRIASERRNVLQWLKESLAVGVIVVAAGFGIHEYIPAQIGNQTRTMGEDVAGLKSSMTTIQHDVAEIKGDIKDALNKAFNRALDNLKPPSAKGSKDRAEAASEIGAAALKLANSLDVPIENSVWQNALSSLRYRSVLNASFNPISPKQRLKPFRGGPFRYVLNFATPPSPPLEQGMEFAGIIWSVGDDVPLSEAARFERIGDTVNNGFKYGPKMIVYETEFGLKLDGMWLKNVVVNNTKVVYSGSSVKLENVYFINCQFEMENRISPRQLAAEVLDSPSVSLNSGT
jgi:hypothetical protein